jgi:hypothetical protein
MPIFNQPFFDVYFWPNPLSHIVASKLLSSMLKVDTLLLVVPFAVFVRRLVMLSFNPLPTFAITPVPPHVNKIGTSFGPSMKRKEKDLTLPYITLPITQFLSS